MKLARSSSKSRRRKTKGRAKKRRVPVWAVLLVVFLAAATIVLLQSTRLEEGRLWLESLREEEPPPDPALLALRVEQAARDALSDLGVAEEQLSVEGVEADGSRSGPVLWEAPLPPGVSLEKANLSVTAAVESVSGRVVDAVEEKVRRKGRRRLTLAVAVDSLRCLELRLHEVRKSKTARTPSPAHLVIVVGGLGRELDSLAKRLIECPFQLTLAVLPGREASAEVARYAHAHGKEVLLHLPMEPRGYPGVDPGAGAILVHHSGREIWRLVRSHIGELDHASGVVNYMGSAGTRDRDVMRAALQEIKRSGLFFIDNSTSVHSVARETADKLGVDCLVNDLFLEEGAKGSGLLKKRLASAEDLALQRGKAVVMAKPTASLLELLAERAGGYASRGIVLAKASELLEDS
jgi:polysaccharide deacetylase 2 family uncharacterized protein YibQ